MKSTIPICILLLFASGAPGRVGGAALANPASDERVRMLEFYLQSPTVVSAIVQRIENKAAAGGDRTDGASCPSLVRMKVLKAYSATEAEYDVYVPNLEDLRSDSNDGIYFMLAHVIPESERQRGAVPACASKAKISVSGQQSLFAAEFVSPPGQRNADNIAYLRAWRPSVLTPTGPVFVLSYGTNLDYEEATGRFVFFIDWVVVKRVLDHVFPRPMLFAR